MLQQLLLYNHDPDIYPGGYRSVPGSHRWRRKGKAVGGGESEPVASISITNDLYIIEAALPGLQREDFLITIRKNRLYVTVRRAREVSRDTYGLPRPHAGYHWQKYTLRLPRNIDTDFISALYENGRLRIIFRRTQRRAGNYVGNVIVY